MFSQTVSLVAVVGDLSPFQDGRMERFLEPWSTCVGPTLDLHQAKISEKMPRYIFLKRLQLAYFPWIIGFSFQILILQSRKF